MAAEKPFCLWRYSDEQGRGGNEPSGGVAGLGCLSVKDRILMASRRAAQRTLVSQRVRSGGGKASSNVPERLGWACASAKGRLRSA